MIGQNIIEANIFFEWKRENILHDSNPIKTMQTWTELIV